MNSYSATERIAAELALVRLQKERREICDRIRLVEEELRQAETSFGSGDVVPSVALPTTSQLPALRRERERSMIPIAGGTLMVTFSVATLVAVAIADGFMAKIGALLRWGGGSVVVYFILMAIVAIIDSSRDNYLKAEINRIESYAVRRGSAKFSQQRVKDLRAALPLDRSSLANVEDEIARNMRILRSGP